MSRSWTTLRAHTRADGALVRIERSAAGRWQVAASRGGVLLGTPRQWQPAPLSDALERDLRATFLARCIEPLALPPEAARARALVEARVAATFAPDEARVLDLALAEGNPKKVVNALDQLRARQRNLRLAALLEGVMDAMLRARLEALGALPAATRAKVTLPTSEARRGN